MDTKTHCVIKLSTVVYALGISRTHLLNSGCGIASPALQGLLREVIAPSRVLIPMFHRVFILTLQTGSSNAYVA